jgi:hypothetical protein
MEQNCIMGSFGTCIFHQVKYRVIELRGNEIGRLHDLYEGEEKWLHSLVGKRERRKPLEELGLDGRTI